MSTADFYDAMVPFYHLIYPDWEASIDRQGSEVAGIIRKRWGSYCTRVLDVTCGIGTQSLGLAANGFDVTASDISPQSVARLNVEAAKRGLQIRTSVGDVCKLREQHAQSFDAVISCDNALPHLNPKDELPLAIHQMFSITRIGGGCLITIRDYANENLTGTQLRPYGLREVDGRKLIAFQTWECREGSYDVTLYFREDDRKTSPKCHRMCGTYYPINSNRVMELMVKAGFENVERLDGVFFQPVLVGERRK